MKLLAMMWEKTQERITIIKIGLSSVQTKPRNEPLIADPQLLHDHVLHDRPEPDELAAIVAQARDPADRPARRGGGGKNSACGNLAVALYIHACRIPIHAGDISTEPCRFADPSATGPASYGQPALRGRSTPQDRIQPILPNFATLSYASITV